MIDARSFVEPAAERGFGLYSGVPCSYLKPFINYVIDSEELRYVGAANEGDAVAIAAGAHLGGVRGVAMCQNSGLGNAVNPLTSLTYTFEIPVLLITTLRGEPGGPADEPQHKLMGQITASMLELMEIPWEYFPTATEDVAPAIDRAVRHMDERGRPYALVMKKGSVDAWPIRSKPQTRPTFSCPAPVPTVPSEPSHTRDDMLQAVQATLDTDDVVVATTGYTGRELYASDDRENQLYMVGSMGCASSFGLGIALAQPARRVVVIDGDGAALMRMGALTTVGYERPANLVHIVLDNGIHESTGGQSTVSHSTDFGAIAAACGYPDVVRINDPSDLAAFLKRAGQELSFAHVKIRPGIPADLPRPTVTPPEVARRLGDFLQRR